MFSVPTTEKGQSKTIGERHPGTHKTVLRSVGVALSWNDLFAWNGSAYSMIELASSPFNVTPLKRSNLQLHHSRQHAPALAARARRRLIVLYRTRCVG